MKWTNCLLKSSLLFSLGFSLWGREFINLNFDQPDLTNLQRDPVTEADYGAPSEIVPGWSITQNGQPIQRVWYYGRGAIRPVTLAAIPGSSGNVYVLSYTGHGTPFSGPSKSTTFSQTGLVPVWALSFEFTWSGRDNNFDTPVRVNGEVVPLRPYPAIGFDYSVDVSRWAGQEVLLSLEFPVGTSGYLHSLAFTVPEPSTWTLAAGGLLVLGVLGKRRAERESR
jgi:hypothetical protein